MPFARLVLMLGYHTRQSDAASRRLAMPMFEVPLSEALNGTSFGVERLRDLVWSSEAPGAWGHSIPLLYPS
jgi:hypothetical protein